MIWKARLLEILTYCGRVPARRGDPSKRSLSQKKLTEVGQTKSQEADPENHGLLPFELEDAIRESMQNGAAGVCLFTPGRMTEAHWEVFAEAIRKDYTDKK